MIKKHLLAILLLTTYAISCNNIADLENEIAKKNLCKNTVIKLYATTTRKIVTPYATVITAELEEKPLAALLENEKDLLNAMQQLLPLYEKENSSMAFNRTIFALCSIISTGLGIYYFKPREPIDFIGGCAAVVLVCVLDYGFRKYKDISLKQSIDESKKNIEVMNNVILNNELNT